MATRILADATNDDPRELVDTTIILSTSLKEFDDEDEEGHLSLRYTPVESTMALAKDKKVHQLSNRSYSAALAETQSDFAMTSYHR